MKRIKMFFKKTKYFFKKVKRSFKRIISNLKKNMTVIKYSIVILVFILCIFSITITFLEVNLRYQGNADIKNNYYDVVMMSATIDYDTSTKIKLNNPSKTITTLINDLNTYKNANSYNVELYNIGSIDAVINKIIITDIDTNVDKDDVSIELSLKEGDVVLGSERKMLNVLIKYDNDEEREDIYYNFNIKISFKELSK